MDTRGIKNLTSFQSNQDKKYKMPVIKEKFYEEENLNTSLNDSHEEIDLDDCQIKSDSLNQRIQKEQNMRCNYSQALGCISTASSIQKSFGTNPNSSSLYMDQDDQLKQSNRKTEQKNVSQVEYNTKFDELIQKIENVQMGDKESNNFESIESIIDFNDNFILIQAVQCISLLLIVLIITFELIYV